MPDWFVTMNNLKAGVRQFFQRRARAGENFHVFRAVQIIFFRDQRAIAVKKNGAFIPAWRLWILPGKNGIEIFGGSAQACLSVCCSQST